jgi:hypothetical protein
VIVLPLVYGEFGCSRLSLIPVLFGVGPNFAMLIGLGMLASARDHFVAPTISYAILGIEFQIFSGTMMCFGGLIGIYA